MKAIMKQYSQKDIDQISSVVEQEDVVKETDKLEIPQVKAVEKVKPTHEQLHEALLFTQDVMERALIPFFALGDTALVLNSVYDPLLEGDEIHLGVKETHLARSSKAILTDLLSRWAKDVYMDENVISFKAKGIPVVIDVIHGSYPFLDNPDPKFYYQGEVMLPNPFNEYWKWKDQIR